MHFLTLKITGNGIPFQEIETAVGRAAQFAYRAGETKDTRFGQVTYAEDGIAFGEEIAQDAEIDQAVRDLVQTCYRNQQLFAQWAQKYRVWLCLSVYPESVQMHVSLSAETLRQMAACGMEMTTSVMSLELFYSGRAFAGEENTMTEKNAKT